MRGRSLSKSDQLRQEIAELRSENHQLFEEWLETSRAAHELRLRSIRSGGDPKLDVEAGLLEQKKTDIDGRRDDINHLVDAHYDELRREASLYRRPSGWWSRLVSRWLGPLPNGLVDIDYDRVEADRAPSRWWLAILTFALVVAGVATSITLLPVTAISPASAVLGQTYTTVVIMGLFTGILITGACYQISGRLSVKTLLSEFALEEELWFRAGAESWTWKQRAVSCVAFGVAHAINLIYAAATLGMIAIAGAVFMAVYLHDLRRTGDRRRALFAAAKLHTNYNLIALGFTAALVVVYWISVVLGLAG